jgi:large conductance mechanosensitive channel
MQEQIIGYQPSRKEGFMKEVNTSVKQATGWIGDFQSFILRGNVVDLAIGVVIGAAFTAVVNSLVNDIIMPFIGALLGGTDFTTLAIQVGDATIAYGKFIQAIITFIIVSLVLFWLIRIMNRFWKKQEGAPAAPAADVVLLTEIRDLLKKQA